MSATGPSAFVVVGDTDWFKPSRRGSAAPAIDSRLRRVNRAFSGASWVSVLGEKLRTANAGGFYAELLIITTNADTTGNSFGLVLSGAESSVATGQYIGAVASTAGMLGDGSVRVAGSTTQSGLGNSGSGVVMGLRLYDDSGTTKVQFYKDGATYGTAETIAAGEYRLGMACYYLSTDYLLRVDADELRYLPAGSQPWGAAARVADVGGYSPGASLFDRAPSTNPATIDAFKRTATATANNAANNAFSSTRNRSNAAGLIYCEFIYESVDGNDMQVGLASSAKTDNVYLGNDSISWGYIQAGGTRHAGSTTTGATAYNTAGTRPGFVWQPSTGKLWFCRNGVFHSGNPQAGTGAHYTNATGNLQPAVTVWQNSPNAGRIRLCTHAREQLYRPSYAEAWDGADLLPEQHFADRLSVAPIVRRAVSFQPWADRGTLGAPIGALDLINADGAFDLLGEWDLRDQACKAYKLRSDGTPAHEWAGVVDSVEQTDANICRVNVGDGTAKLDVRVNAPAFALGYPQLFAAKTRIGSSIANDVCQTNLCSFSVQDQALSVTSWYRSDLSGQAGYIRTANPAGLQSVTQALIYRLVSDLAISNGDLSAWTAGNPDNWTKYLSGTGAAVTQSGSKAAFAGGNNTAALWHAATITSGKYYAVVAKVDAASTSSGGFAMTFQFESTAGAYDTGGTFQQGFLLTEARTGTFTGILQASGNYTGFSVAVFFQDNATIDDIYIYEVEPTWLIDKALAMLFQNLGGFSSTQWQYTAPFSPYSPPEVGYWTDDRPTIRSIIAELLGPLTGDCYTDKHGVVQVAWLVPPDEVSSSGDLYAGTIAESEVFSDLTVEDDFAPNLSTRAQFDRNYVKHNDGHIAGSVTATARTYATSEGRENVLDLTASTAAAAAKALHPFYSHANGARALPRLVIGRAAQMSNNNLPVNGDVLRDNRLILLHRCYAQRRRFYSLSITRDKADELNVAPGRVVEVTHARYGLSAGKNLMITAIEQDITAPIVALRLWG